MGTRGFITFVIDGAEKTAYNHWDSYPEGLGQTVLSWLRDALADTTGLRARVAALVVAEPGSRPAAEVIERFRKYSWTKEQHGGTGDLREGQEWYDLLHETQGKPALILEAGVIEDASAFPRDSLFAEWGYVADFDAGNFEVYEGFQMSPHAAGRFADQEPDRESDGYYPVALKVSWPFSSLPSDEDFMAAFAEPEDEEPGPLALSQ
jgi:hypothetical protein